MNNPYPTLAEQVSAETDRIDDWLATLRIATRGDAEVGYAIQMIEHSLGRVAEGVRVAECYAAGIWRWPKLKRGGICASDSRRRWPTFAARWRRISHERDCS